LPSLENLHQQFKGKPFVILGIDIQEERSVVQDFVRDENISFPVLLDEDGEVSFQYSIRAHPQKFLINPEGNIIGIAEGYRKWDSEIVKSLIQQLITPEV
jgi:peroxiredoxin